MSLEHSEKTHSNWREQMLKALQEGMITTIITFDNVRYLVTLQPYTQPEGSVERGLCSVCSHVALKRVGDAKWYHEDPKYGNHAATVEGWVPVPAAAQPVGFTSGQEAVCSMCQAKIVWAGLYWDHVGENKPRHPAIPVDGSPYS